MQTSHQYHHKSSIWLFDLQEWDTHTAAGLAAVNSLQRSFGEVDGTGSTLTNESLHVYQRLMELVSCSEREMGHISGSTACSSSLPALLRHMQAPSFQLERYIQQRQHPTPTASDAASQIHAALNKLHAAVTSAQGLLECLSSISSQYQEAVLSQQLKCATQLSSVTAIACQAAAATVEGSRSLTAATSNPEPNDDDPEASTEAAVLQPEELAILMVAVVSGMQQDLQWMVSHHGATQAPPWRCKPWASRVQKQSLICTC